MISKLLLAGVLMFTPVQYVPPSALLGCTPLEPEMFRDARLIHTLRVGVRLVLEFWVEGDLLFVVKVGEDGKCLVGSTPLLPADGNDA